MLRIVISEPRRLNVVDMTGHRELAEVWHEAGRDDAVRAVLVRGEGEFAGPDAAEGVRALREKRPPAFG